MGFSLNKGLKGLGNIGKGLAKVATSKIGSTVISAAASVVGSPAAGLAVKTGLTVLNKTVVADMAKKVVEKGNVNLASVKQTLLEKTGTADTKVVNTIAKELQTVAKMSGKTVPIVNQMTNKQAAAILPELPKMKAAAADAGKVDTSKIVETLKKNGIEAVNSVVMDVAKVIDQANPDVSTPIDVNHETSTRTWWIVGGVAGFISLAGIVFYSLKRR